MDCRIGVALALFLAGTAARAEPPKGILGTSGCFEMARAPAGAFYVRPDGGDATQCTGRANAPYPGKGTGQPCAFAHPFHALPPGGTPRIAGGDLLVIAPGHYRMGLGAPGSEACRADTSYDCVMPPVPSGPSPSRPTRIAGTLDGRGGLPELWGTERAWYVMNLKGTQNAEISCLEITDRSSCVEFHPGKLACERDQAPYGDWAASGLLAVDSRHVVLRSLDIHGLASTGITAGRVADWTLIDVFLSGNGLAGWQGDLGEQSADAGTMTFRRVTFDWNGCGESATREPLGCWAEEAGGFGAGLGGATGGTWRFEDSRFLRNAGAGLDATGPVGLDLVWAEGNGGPQLRVRGQLAMTRSVAVGTSGGDTVHVEGSARVTQSTLVGQTGALLGLSAESCSAIGPVTAEKNVFLGNDRAAALVEECGGLEGAGPPVVFKDNVIWQVRDDVCAQNLCVDPQLDPTTLSPRAPIGGRGAR